MCLVGEITEVQRKRKNYPGGGETRAHVSQCLQVTFFSDELNFPNVTLNEERSYFLPHRCPSPFVFIACQDVSAEIGLEI